MNCSCPPWNGEGFRPYSLLCPVHGDPRLSNVIPKETSMNDEHELAPPRVKVSFHRSSARDGQTGYSVEGSEGLVTGEAMRVFAIVAELKRMADAELAPRDTLASDLERSLSNARP